MRTLPKIQKKRIVAQTRMFYVEELDLEFDNSANRLTHLKTFTVVPGLTGHQTEVVLAQDLYPQKQQGDEPE